MHPTKIEGYELKELAEKIENLRYDKTQEFLEHLSKAFKKRSESDYKAGRVVLSNMLSRTHDQLRDAAYEMRNAWYICKVHMDKEGTDYREEKLKKEKDGIRTRIRDWFYSRLFGD